MSNEKAIALRFQMMAHCAFRAMDAVADFAEVLQAIGERRRG